MPLAGTADLLIDFDAVITTDGTIGGVGLSPDDSRLYAAFWEDNPSSRVQEYSLSDGQLLQTIEYGSYHTHADVVVSADGNRIFTANYYYSTISEIDLANGNARTDLSTIDSWPNKIDITPDRTKVLVSVGMDGRSYDMNNDSIAIYDISDGNFSLLSSVTLDDEPRDLALSADSQFAYVVTYARKSAYARLYEISLSETCEVTRFMEISGVTHLWSVAAAGDKVFLSSHDDSSIRVVDVPSWSVVSEIDVTDAPGVLAMHPGGRYLFATLSAPQAVVAIDVQSEEIAARYDGLQAQPLDLEFTSDGGKMYISHYTAGGDVWAFNINFAPAAQDDAYVVDEDATLSVAAAGVLANDTGADEDTLSAVLVSGPSHGTLGLESDGSFSYTADADYHGTDSFTYKASDGELDSGVATVTITVNPVNDAPAIGDSDLVLSAQTINEGDSVNLGGSFSDPEGGTHTVTVDWGDGTADAIQLAAGVTSFDSADHTYADDPAGSQQSYAIAVTVADQEGSSETAQTSVLVENVAPTLNVCGDWMVVAGKAFTISNIGQFSDPGFNGETFTATIDWGDGTTQACVPEFTDGEPGTPTTGSFDGRHTYNATGVYSVTVTLTDDDGGAAAQQFTISVGTDLVGFFVTPRGGWLYVKALGGSAEANTEFGLGTSVDTHQVVLADLPRSTEEVLARHVHANQELHFSLKSELAGETVYAFSSGNDAASMKSFTDQDNSLGLGGSILEQVGTNTWVLHLDDPVHDVDDDNDVVIQIRIGAAPPSLDPPHNSAPRTTPPRVNPAAPPALPIEVGLPAQAADTPTPRPMPVADALNGSSVFGQHNGAPGGLADLGSGGGYQPAADSGMPENAKDSQPGDTAPSPNVQQDSSGPSETNPPELGQESNAQNTLGDNHPADGATNQSGATTKNSNSSRGDKTPASAGGKAQPSSQGNSSPADKSSEAKSGAKPTAAKDNAGQPNDTAAAGGTIEGLVDEAISDLGQEPEEMSGEDTDRGDQAYLFLRELPWGEEYVDEQFESDSLGQMVAASATAFAFYPTVQRSQPGNRSSAKKAGKGRAFAPCR